jgi:GxxExxY protein
VYEECLCHELQLREIALERQRDVQLVYKNQPLSASLKIDILIPDELVIEIKAVSALLPIHEAQLLTYLRLTEIHRGLLLNFNVPVLKDGIRRMVL